MAISGRIKYLNFIFLVVSAVLTLHLVVSATMVFALTDSYFGFSLPENVLIDGQEIVVQFTWNIRGLEMLEQKRFTVKPFISAGAVEIYNEALDKYVGIADFNSTLPYIQKEVRLKFVGVQNLEAPASLYFVIYDLLTGEKYQTPVKSVWGTAYYKKYTDLLNESILRTSDDAKVSMDLPSGKEEPIASTPRDPVKFYLWYLSPAFFLYGLLKSPNGFG